MACPIFFELFRYGRLHLSRSFFPTDRVGTDDLQHRVAMALMAGSCANTQHVRDALALEYHKRRTSAPETLIIT